MKRARYRGDVTANIHPGQIIGQTLDGVDVKCVAVDYDPGSDTTTVTGHHTAAAAPDGTRIRYHGDTTGAGQAPGWQEPLTDPIEAQ